MYSGETRGFFVGLAPPMGVKVTLGLRDDIFCCAGTEGQAIQTVFEFCIIIIFFMVSTLFLTACRLIRTIFRTSPVRLCMRIRTRSSQWQPELNCPQILPPVIQKVLVYLVGRELSKLSTCVTMAFETASIETLKEEDTAEVAASGISHAAAPDESGTDGALTTTRTAPLQDVKADQDIEGSMQMQMQIKDTDVPSDLDTATPDEHARIGDPVEPPARNAPKKKPDRPLPTTSAHVGRSSSAVTGDNESILSRLFDPDRKQKPQLWTHIKLVAPGPNDKPPPGHIKWRSKDAIAAYCLKCKKQFTYTKGTSKTIR